MLHDHCYDKAIDTHMCFDVPVEYVEDYSWACNTSANGNEPFCYGKYHHLFHLYSLNNL